MSFRNRCRIAGANGAIDLSIPLEKGRDQKALLKDTRISGSRRWQAEHWKTILSCYSRSLWFEFYRYELELLYRKPVVFLADWDLACFDWSVRALGLSLAISFTESFRKTYEEGEWVDWRGKILPKTINGLPDRDILTGKDLPLSTGTGGRIDGDSPRYRQVFEERTGFLPGLSILDLLCCEGRNARKLLS